MKLTVLDLETTGFLPDAKITELCWATYDTLHQRVLDCWSFLINPWLDSPQTEMTEEAGLITGLDRSLCQGHGLSTRKGMEQLLQALEDSQAMVASNGEHFDKRVIEKELDFCGIRADLPPCIDDYYDIEYPDHVKGKSLSHKAADLGFLNPFPHWAIGDVLTLIQVMERAGVDWIQALDSAKQPVVKVKAMVPFEQKHLASQENFTWEKDIRSWTKQFRKGRIPQFSFPCKILGEE